MTHVVRRNTFITDRDRLLPSALNGIVRGFCFRADRENGQGNFDCCFFLLGTLPPPPPEVKGEDSCWRKEILSIEHRVESTSQWLSALPPVPRP